MNLLLWTDDLNDGMLPVLEQLKADGLRRRRGADLQSPTRSICREWGKRLDDLGLGAHRRHDSHRGRQPDHARSAKCAPPASKATKRTLDCCQAARRRRCCAARIHSALGEFSGAGPTADEWKWGVESMRQIAEHAADAGVMLGVEYLNRFETLPSQLRRRHGPFRRGSESSQLPDDVRHVPRQHRREEHPPTRSAPAPPYTVHVHISENDRSTPGQGHVAWKETFDTLTGNRLRRLDGRRSLRPRPARTRRRHQDLAPHVPERRTTRPRRARVHEERNRKANDLASWTVRR